MTEPVRLIVTALMGAVGLFCSAWLWKHSRVCEGSPRWRNELLRGDRPWRRLGAAIVGFVAVMFFAGVNWIDGRRSPVAFALFWLGVLLLVLWLCMLAWIDIRHTQRLRAELSDRQRGQRPPRDDARNSRGDEEAR